MIATIILLALPLPLVLAQDQRCQWSPLRNSADLFREGLESGEFDASLVFNEDARYLENGKLLTPSTGILAGKKKIPIDHDHTLIDQDACAVYTELVSLGDNKGGGTPYVIGAQLFFGPSSTPAAPLEVINADIVVTTTGDWRFNATRTLEVVRKEKWESLFQTERTPRDTLRAAADVYLDLGSGLVNVTDVPWGQPCARLEGSLYTEGSCSDGFEAYDHINRRYVIDETVGAVSVFSATALDAPTESHLFRIENGKLRYVHRIVARQADRVPEEVVGSSVA